MIISYYQVMEMETMKTGSKALKGLGSGVKAAERAMDDVTDFMSKKATKQEQEVFLQQVLFGM